jgi:hypothetical protein
MPSAKHVALDRMYDYQRKLPHYQKLGQPLFITFCKLGREPFSGPASSVILQHCAHDHGKRVQLSRGNRDA